MAKSDKVKVPKTVAGFKVPKALRKSGILDTLVGTPAGRQLLADAIMAAAGAAAATLVASKLSAEPEKTGRKTRAGGQSGLGEATHAAAGALASFVGEAAANLLTPGSGARERKAGKTGDDEVPSRAGKPQRAKRQAAEPPRAEAEPSGA
jgi:hypothetical protein